MFRKREGFCITRRRNWTNSDTDSPFSFRWLPSLEPYATRSVTSAFVTVPSVCCAIIRQIPQQLLSDKKSRPKEKKIEENNKSNCAIPFLSANIRNRQFVTPLNPTRLPPNTLARRVQHFQKLSRQVLQLGPPNPLPDILGSHLPWSLLIIQAIYLLSY